MAKKVHLTKKKQRWLGKRTVNLTGTVLRQCISDEERYAKKLQALTQRMTEDVTRQVLSLFESKEGRALFAEDAAIGSKGRILLNKLMSKYYDQFKQLSKPFALSMVNDVDKTSKSGLFNSIQKLTGGAQIKMDIAGPKIRQLMTDTITENRTLIENIPQVFIPQVSGLVMRNVTSPSAVGIKELSEQIQEQIGDYSEKATRRAKSIAYDQTRKFYNHLNAERMQAIGINKFKWVHSKGGQFPRIYHLKELDGNIYSLDDPPIIDKRTGQRGIPGDAINCRCTMVPIIEFDDGEEVE